MAQATVKTVQFLDTRIEPQPDPVYDHVIAPTQNQYYKIPASGLGGSSITFSNLTTLGTDRAYLDTFELEIEATIAFESSLNYNTTHREWNLPFPCGSDWTFDSFPFSKCCDQIRVNINGGAFFSEPLSYLRAKERYMKQYELSKCYENVCPIHRAIGQTESGRCYNADCDQEEAIAMLQPANGIDNTSALERTTMSACQFPTRYGYGVNGFMQSETGYEGGFNNSIVRTGNVVTRSTEENPPVQITEFENIYCRPGANGHKITYYRVKWREPVCCSPFSSKYDATYGRPLYNITSMDLAFNLQSLTSMIRVANFTQEQSSEEDADDAAADQPFCSEHVVDYTVTINNCALCYQVMTIPPTMTKPLTTLVPYRRFVPFISNYPGNSQGYGAGTTPININGEKGLEMRSGVYTLNEVPTAIWLFVAPTKSIIQSNPPDSFVVPQGAAASLDAANLNNVNYWGNWDSNRLFAFIKHVDISLSNTTQILNTADVPDLYRIAKANGCQDSYLSWAGNDVLLPKPLNSARTYNDAHALTSLVTSQPANTLAHNGVHQMFYGAGSVLRLKPGVDLVVPDQPLIPGANAKNMVFQASVKFDVPPHSTQASEYALWLIFEYVGVAAISPGQCEITMNPLGNGDIMENSPILSGSTAESEGVVDTLDSREERAVGMGIKETMGKISNFLRKLIKTGEDYGGDIKILAENAANLMEGKHITPANKKANGVMGKGQMRYRDWMN